jgi:ferredoxin-NADP reductase
LPLRWTLDEYLPNTLLTVTWADAQKRRQADALREQWLPYAVVNIVAESSVIKSFYLQPKNNVVPSFKPGQFLTIKHSVDGKYTIRIYTVSSAPADTTVRISVKREMSLNKDVPDGLFSNFIHSQLAIADTVYAKAPMGEFVFDAAGPPPAVILSGGVGITPMVSMARHAMTEGVRTRSVHPTTLICAASNSEQRAFFKELRDIEQQSNSAIRSFWALNEI